MKGKKNTKVIFIANIIFYLFISLHKIIVNKYGDDIIIQGIFYSALFFSSIIAEESVRKDLKKIRTLAIIDFIIRIAILIIHFLYLYMNLNFFIVNIVTSIAFIINIILELLIIDRRKMYEIREVSDEELHLFIEDFYNRKLDFLKLGSGLNKELKEIMDSVKKSGEGNIFLVILFVLHFISGVLYNHNKYMIIMIIAFNIFILRCFIKSNINFLMCFESKRNKKVHLENILFVMGYIILFLSEVVFHGYFKYMRVSFWALSIIFFYPVFSSKYIAKEKLKEIYINISLSNIYH